MNARSVGRTNAPEDAAFPQDFRDFIHELNRHGVEYLLVGGYAVGVYGFVRATADIDFFYRCTADNVARLVEALVAFGAPPVVIDATHLTTPNMVTAFGQPPLRIDLLASISGVTFDDALQGAQLVTIAEETLPVIGLAALRANKAASGRSKDREDLRQLPDVPRLASDERG